MLRGIDVSHYQGDVDWKTVIQKLGLSFAYVKALEGETSNDSKFHQNWAGLAGRVTRGAYQYVHPDSNPNDDCDAFLNRVNPNRASDYLVCDLETTKMSATDTAAWACQWADRLKHQSNKAAGLYCGGYMHVSAYAPLKDHFDFWILPRYPLKYQGKQLWPTTFNPVLPQPKNVWGKSPDFWQFSSTYPINGDTDANVFNGSLNELMTLNDVTSPKPAHPVIAPSTEDIMAATGTSDSFICQEEGSNEQWLVSPSAGTKRALWTSNDGKALDDVLPRTGTPMSKKFLSQFTTVDPVA